VPWTGLSELIAKFLEPLNAISKVLDAQKFYGGFADSFKVSESVFEPLKLYGNAFEAISNWPSVQTKAALSAVLSAGTFVLSPSWTMPATTGDTLLSSLEAMNATTFDVDRAVEIQRHVEEAFVEAATEEFEEGAQSSFSRALVSLIVTFGNDTLKAIEQLLDSPAVDPEVAGEALRQIGVVRHDDSKKYRRVMLEQQLRSPSHRRRYAAALGLAAMDDPAAISALEETIALEQDSRLRRYLSLVLEQLQDTESGGRIPDS
jgi:HEAT repeat protein